MWSEEDLVKADEAYDRYKDSLAEENQKKKDKHENDPEDQVMLSDTELIRIADGKNWIVKAHDGFGNNIRLCDPMDYMSANIIYDGAIAGNKYVEVDLLLIVKHKDKSNE